MFILRPSHQNFPDLVLILVGIIFASVVSNFCKIVSKTNTIGSIDIKGINLFCPDGIITMY